MATCPHCGVSSRVDPDAISVDRSLVAKPLGTWSLAGQQMKTVVVYVYTMRCKCGWHIDGDMDESGQNFYGRPQTQVFPPSE